MSVFLEIARQHAAADAAFESAIVVANQVDDRSAFDQGWLDRARNDQAYFLFLFTRFEEAINQAFASLIANKSAGLWQDVRAWSVWEGKKLSDIPLLLKASLLLQKGRKEYNDVREFYKGRNDIAHGSQYDEPFVIQVVARRMTQITQAFVTT